jgi:hypothetical protein
VEVKSTLFTLLWKGVKCVASHFVGSIAEVGEFSCYPCQSNPAVIFFASSAFVINYIVGCYLERSADESTRNLRANNVVVRTLAVHVACMGYVGNTYKILV